METLKSCFSFDKESLISNLSKIVMDRKAHKANSVEPHLPVLQTVGRHCAAVVNYQTYRLSSRSTRYDKTDFSYISKLAKKVKAQVKALFFIPKVSVSIIGIITTFELACDANHIHKKAAMWALLHLVHETLANARNSCMYAKNRLAPYTNQAIAENDTSIPWYVQP